MTTIECTPNHSHYVQPTTFPLGQIVSTANAQSSLTPQEIADGLARHAKGDWGSVSAESVEQNNEAVGNGDRVMSAFGKGRKRFWIITEADRSVTTILMPGDY